MLRILAIFSMKLSSVLVGVVATGEVAAAQTKTELLKCNAVFSAVGVMRMNGTALPSDVSSEIGGDNPSVWARISLADPKLSAMPDRARREATLAQVSTANADYFDANFGKSALIMADYRRCIGQGVKPDIGARGRYVNRADWDW